MSDRIIEQRINKFIGFGATTEARTDHQSLHQVDTQDLLRFGMIPEFIGRVPVIASLGELDEAALVDILTKPRNALIKQYQKLFEMEGVTLKFTDDSLEAVAREAIRRKTGARGLRAILEEIMLDVMYDLPSKENVRRVHHRRGGGHHLKAPWF